MQMTMIHYSVTIFNKWLEILVGVNVFLIGWGGVGGFWELERKQSYYLNFVWFYSTGFEGC